MFWVFRQEACRVLVLQPGIEPAPLALGGEDLTTARLAVFMFIVYRLPLLSPLEHKIQEDRYFLLCVHYCVPRA